MPVVGISAGEIIRAIEIAQEIYRRFCLDDPPDAKYRRFLEHIQVLANGLERLNGTLEPWHNSAQQNNATPHLWIQLAGDFHLTLMECASLLKRYRSLRDGRPRVVSVLRCWLKFEPEVDRLMPRLRYHSDQVETYCNPIKVQTALKQARDIQQLRQQMANLERMIVHGVDESQTPWARILWPNIEARLELQFDANRPPWSNDQTIWPLREAFEAVAFHFARGTVNFIPSPDLGDTTGVMQHLNLAKACWILEKTRQSPEYRARGTDSVYTGIMSKYEEKIKVELHRYENSEIRSPAERLLAELSDEDFALTANQEEDSDLQSSCGAGILEEEILQIDLKPPSVNTKSTLTVFRESNTEFRVLFSTEQQQGSRIIQRYDNHLVTERHRVIPAYADPSTGNLLGNNLLIVNERGDMKRTIELAEATEIRKLQQAFTGYHVLHYMPITRWCINGSMKTGNEGKGGMLQFWQYKPLPPIVRSNHSQPSNEATFSGSVRSSTQSFGLPMPSVDTTLELPFIFDGQSLDCIEQVDSPGLSNASLVSTPTQHELQRSSHSDPVSQVLQEGSNAEGSQGIIRNTGVTHSSSSLFRTSQSTQKSRNGSKGTDNILQTASGMTSLRQSSVQSPVRGPKGNGIQLLKPQLPALVILTMSGGRYTIFYLSLADSIYVEPKSCDCRNRRRSCNRIILESREKSFELRQLSADKEGSRGFESWDLSVFRSPPSLEKSQKTTKKSGIKTLELKFEDETQKNTFLEALRSLETIRAVNHNEYVKSLKELEWRNAKNRG